MGIAFILNSASAMALDERNTTFFGIPAIKDVDAAVYFSEQRAAIWRVLRLVGITE
jgi:hypothetical protein